MRILAVPLRLEVCQPLDQVLLKLDAALDDWCRVTFRGCMQILAVAAVIALGQVIRLRGAGREPHRSTLPGIVAEVRVEDLLCGREVSPVPAVHVQGRREHTVTEDSSALVEVVLQVDTGVAQRACDGGSVEVAHLCAGLIAPGARVDVPAGGICKRLGVVCSIQYIAILQCKYNKPKSLQYREYKNPNHCSVENIKTQCNLQNPPAQKSLPQ